MEVNLKRELLVKARYAKGMSIPELAKAAHVTVQTVYSIEGGRRTPSPKTLVKMCGALDVDAKDVIEVVA